MTTLPHSDGLAAMRRFRAEREADWAALEALLDTAERKSLRALSDDDLVALPVLYRATLSALSVARATSLDADLIAYLESLSARAYFFVYGVRDSGWRRLRRYFAQDWPRAVQALWPETGLALLLMLAGTLIGFALVAGDPAWFHAFVPAELAAGRDPEASAASLRATLYEESNGRGLTVLAGFLFTNNAQVAIVAFALGFAAAVPTCVLMISTGCMLGAFVALFARHGLTMDLMAWLMIHGTTELFAVVLAGAAGLHLGRALLFPGRRARSLALRQAGQPAAIVMIGVGLMLLVAALLEGYARQLIVDPAVRYGVAGAMLLGWLAYFYRPRGDHG